MEEKGFGSRNHPCYVDNFICGYPAIIVVCKWNFLNVSSCDEQSKPKIHSASRMSARGSSCIWKGDQMVTLMLESVKLQLGWGTGRCVGWNWTHWIPSSAVTRVPSSRHVFLLHFPADCVEFRVSVLFFLGVCSSTCVFSVWGRSSATSSSCCSSAVSFSCCSSVYIP